MLMHRRGILQCSWHNLLPTHLRQSSRSAAWRVLPGVPYTISVSPDPCITAPPSPLFGKHWGHHGEHITSLPHTPLAVVQFSLAWHLALHWVYEEGQVGFSMPFWLSSWAVIWYITNSSSCEVERICSIGLKHRRWSSLSEDLSTKLPHNHLRWCAGNTIVQFLHSLQGLHIIQWHSSSHTRIFPFFKKYSVSFLKISV